MSDSSPQEPPGGLMEDFFLWCGYGLAMCFLLVLCFALRRRVRTGALLSRNELLGIVAILVLILACFFAWTLV
ncbi:hypothetical protein E2F48_15055 [Arthrobacter crusticola]|uniref:Uncharacterized protein n=1 Tax=Arthrobacter crusticola TaxID=2547960 RepID=A0A4R5TSM2_9MICC|nr:hypothetical protein [Arthrobacter crusticola]TDK24094.1 hypothetical protein E2F48_15055 [Arthrobacter crusticola]